MTPPSLRALDGLDGMVYQAFKGRWEDLAWTANRTLEVARGE